MRHWYQISEQHSRLTHNCLAYRRKWALILATLVWAAAIPYTIIADNLFALSQPLTARWQYKTERTVNLTPAVYGNYVYLPLASGAIISLHVPDGELFWKADTGGEFSASPVADHRGVYVASETVLPSHGRHSSSTGVLRALGRTTGITLWVLTLHSPIRGSLVSSETMLFGGAADGRICAVSKETGEILWVTQHAAPLTSHPTLSQGRLYIGGEDGTLLALDQLTGRVIWRYRTQEALRSSMIIADGMVLFGSTDGYVYALNEVDGRLRWRARTGAGVQAVAYGGSGLVVASLDNFVYFFSLRRGDRIWKRQLPGRVAAQPLTAADGALFAPLAGDACVVLDLHDGKQLNSLPVGEDNNTAASPVVVGNILLVTTRRGLVAFAAPLSNSSAESGMPSAQKRVQVVHD